MTLCCFCLAACLESNDKDPDVSVEKPASSQPVVQQPEKAPVAVPEEPTATPAEKIQGKAPIIAFSDLISAPVNGWSNANANKGAVVSIWGQHFGEARSDSYITVGGIKLKSDSDYIGSWGEQGKPVPQLQRIRFQLNDTLPRGLTRLSITVAGQTSNEVAIRLTDNRIYFIDGSSKEEVGEGTYEVPWRNISAFTRVMQPGDVIYLRGQFGEQQIGGQETFYIRNIETFGTKENPISFVGWPGQEALFNTVELDTPNSPRLCIRVNAEYMTFSNLNFICKTASITSGAKGTRMIGNHGQGPMITPYGEATFIVQRDEAEVLGNHASGARSANRLDHAIYMSGCPTNVGAKVGYNYVSDFSVGAGPYIVVNHQGNRCSEGNYLASHHIFNNFMDCSDYPSRGIGVYHQGGDSNDSQEPKPTYVYNNVTYKCGFSFWGANYQNSAHVVWLNNAFLASGGSTALWISNKERLRSTVIKNNIFEITDPNRPALRVQDDIVTDISHNIYRGSKLPAPNLEQFEVDVEPNCDVNTQKATINCNKGLHARGIATDIVKDDYALKARPAVPSVGAIEVEE